MLRPMVKCVLFRACSFLNGIAVVLVVEDAVSGILSGRAAGSKTLAVCTTTPHEVLIAKANPDYIVPDLTQ